MANSILIATASWEERCELGILASIADGEFGQVFLLRSKRYQNRTETVSPNLQEACSSRGIRFVEQSFDSEDQVGALRTIDSLLAGVQATSAGRIVFDISTTPRPIVWSILDALGQLNSSLTIRYYAGVGYGEWQTTEEGAPRLVLRRSGIMYPDQPTSLILLCGPEISKAEKMCFHFEPKSVLILRDPRAENYGTVRQLPTEYRALTDEIGFDNKDIGEENFQRLDSIAQRLLNNVPPNNVVVAALGPKLGSLLLYRLVQERPEIGLSYVVSGKHNPEATQGLGARTDIQWPLNRS